MFSYSEPNNEFQKTINAGAEGDILNTWLFTPIVMLIGTGVK